MSLGCACGKHSTNVEHSEDTIYGWELDTDGETVLRVHRSDACSAPAQLELDRIASGDPNKRG